MSYISKELKRVEKYAQGLGIKVSYKKKGPTDPEADWSTDGTEITVYLRNRQSITQIILDLIHELGHHMEWIYNSRKIPSKLDKVLDKENHSKQERKIILEDEINGSKYHLSIYNELGLKIPKWKVILERDLSLLVYKYYYKYGKFPTNKIKKELILKLKSVILNK